MKILFITLSNIGDAVMTTPVLQFLIKQYPLGKFDLVCDKKSYEIFNGHPSVNKIYFREKNQGIIKLLKFIIGLRVIHYDLAIDLRTDLLLYFIKADKKIFKISNNRVHSVEKHFLSVSKDLKNIPDPFIFIPGATKKKIKKFISKNEKKLLTVCLGAKSEHKIWPVEKYIGLINKIKSKFNAIILIGDKNDEARGRIFSDKVNGQVINLTGKLSLIETSAIIKLSDLFILTSKYEGLPNVLLEAMTLKKFIISSDCPSGPKEILDNGKGGFLFKHGDYKDLLKKLVYLNKNFENFKYFESKINFAHKRLFRFNYEEILDKYFYFVNELFKKI